MIVTAALVALFAWSTPVDDLAVRFRQAIDAQKAGDLEAAGEGYEQVIAANPQFAEAYLNLGLLRSEQRRYDDAAAALTRAVKLKPGLGAAHLFLGIAEYSRNRTEAALPPLQRAVQLLPKDSRARMWLGLAYLDLGRLSDAASAIDEASRLSPGDQDILYHRGRVHLRISQESYREMFRVDPKSARVHQVLAQSYDEAGRDEDAITEYERTRKLNPNLPGVNDELGSIYWRNEKLEQAEECFVRELAIAPHNALALFKLGAIKARRGNPADGLPYLERAVKEAPGLLYSYYYLGKAQAATGAVEQAEKNLLRVVEGDPDGQLTESAWYQLAQMYRRQNRNADAVKALEAYRKLKEQHESVYAEKLEAAKRRLPE